MKTAIITVTTTTATHTFKTDVKTAREMVKQNAWMKRFNLTDATVSARIGRVAIK